MKKQLFVMLCTICLVSNLCSTASATTFDVAADFSATNNPNGVWSYGWSSTLTSDFNLYPNNGKFDELLNIDIWTDYGRFSSYYPTPQVSHNGTGIEITHPTITWLPGQFSLHPGEFGEYSHARWTAPDAGTIDIASMFTGIDRWGTTTDVHVLRNGISLFDGLVNGFGNTSSFSTTVTVGKGDIIDFAVGYGVNQSHTCDTTALSATISFVPEPAIEAVVDINPNTLNLQSKGKWITCYISFPEDVNIADVNSNTVLLNSTIKAEWTWVEEEEQVMMAKFNRSAVQDILQPGQAELTVSGKLLNGRRFEGKDTITVINKGKQE